MLNSVAPGVVVSVKKIEQKRNFSFVTIATRVFDGIKFFQEILRWTMAGSFL